MKALTKEGGQYVTDIAGKYNLKPGSVESLLRALVSGGGTMAQFNIPELGGQGQWMRGGMTMVGDMFNNSLRTTVDKLCTELSGLITTQVLFEENGEPAQEGLPGSGAAEQSGFSAQGSTSWPAVFGSPTASGSQNNFRYAYFAPVRRLVIEENGKRTIYDTKHHHITGVSQQQGGGSSWRFTSQDGDVDLVSLAVISEPGQPSQPTPEIAYDVTSTADLRADDHGKSPEDIIMSTIERINILFERGQISEEEFKAKKQELLARL